MKRELELQAIVSRHSADRTRLMDILWDAHATTGFVSEADLVSLGQALGTSPALIREVLTFYHFFCSTPPGRFAIYLDTSIIADLSGMKNVREAFEQEIGIKTGEVSADGQFGLFRTSCIGMSDQSPAALINSVPFPSLTPDRARHIIRSLRAGDSLASLSEELPVTNRVLQAGPILLNTEGSANERKDALAVAGSLTPQAILAEIKNSGLRGRGGAGFPTGLKWELCRNSPGTRRFVVCNADEGEPGTFKDRLLLTEYADAVLEGMAIAAKAIDASDGIIYLRAEYRYLLSSLEERIQRFNERNPLAPFSLRVQLGAGAYVCGEESALLESLEGKRGEPRLKPPFPVEKGYLGHPTVVNNVETFALVSRILALGAERFRSFGTERSAGVRLLSISGDVERPGIYEVPWGIRLGEVLALCGAQDPLMIQVGGPSGICVRATETDRTLSYEDLSTGGSFMVFSKERDLFAVLTNFMEFFVDESCGNCAPCRSGNVVLRDLLARFRDGHARPEDLVKIDSWSRIITKTARCGLGTSSPHVLTSSYQAFPELYEKAIDPSKSPLVYDFDVAAATAEFDATMRETK